jgi:hypothetical protein
VSIYWRVAWKPKSGGAQAEIHEDYLTESSAKARKKRLEDIGRDVLEPYRVELEPDDEATEESA